MAPNSLLQMAGEKVLDQVLNDLNANPAQWRKTDYHKCLVRDNADAVGVVTATYTVVVQAGTRAHRKPVIEYIPPGPDRSKHIIVIWVRQSQLPGGVRGEWGPSSLPGYVDITGRRFGLPEDDVEDAQEEGDLVG
jgi:hypothetical protein